LTTSSEQPVSYHNPFATRTVASPPVF
jgi:hypothetical protein